jgi:6-phosphogluconolactonase
MDTDVSQIRFVLVVGFAMLAAGLSGQGATSSPSGDVLVYFGTYTGEKSTGVYVSRLDVASGALTAPELAGEAVSPSFLAVHPSQNFLYAVNEIGNFQGKESGAVTAFAIDRTTGRLTALNQQPSVGRGPAHLVVDKTGRHVLVANYGGGSVAVVPIGTDGVL